MAKKQTIFLYPSNIFVCIKPAIVTTLLGPCVSVCLCDSILNYGGINHYMLPLWNGTGLASPKYGNIAIKKLYDKMIDLGSNSNHIKAKVFGGGVSMNSDYFKIGQRNIEVAFNILDQMKIPIIGSSCGGQLGRKIIFNTENGNILQKYIQKTEFSFCNLQY